MWRLARWALVLIGLSLVQWTPVSSVSQSPPEISVIERYIVNETYSVNTTCQFHSHGRSQCFIPWNANISFIEMKCMANYPVTWSLKSFSESRASRLATERTIGKFDDPSSYLYSMTLHVKEPKADQLPKELDCHSVDSETETDLISAITFKFEESLHIAILNLSSTALEVPDGKAYWRDAYVNSTNPDFIWSFPDRQHVECCIESETFLKTNIKSVSIIYGRFMQLGFYNKLSSTPFVNSSMCRSIAVQPDNYIPNVYICRMEEDDGSRRDSGRIMGTSSLFVHLEFKSMRDSTKSKWVDTLQESHATEVYVGDQLIFRCHAAPFHYAVGMVWELTFQNGTSEYKSTRNVISERGANSVQILVELVDDSLKTISCHVPPWNSSNWLTRSITLTVNPSSPPVSLLGEAHTLENITFYTGQSVQLRCDFTGEPEPTFRWWAKSAIYLTHSQIGSTISVSIGNWTGDNGTIPGHTFSCIASNVAGTAMKFFNVQAVESFPPAMDNTAREAVVFYANEENNSLNCTVNQGTPIPEFVWHKHGQNISWSDEYEEVTTDMASFLIFKKVRHGDEAEYTCIAHNFRGSIFKEFSVRVRDLAQPQQSQSVVITSITIGATLLATVLVAALAYVYVTKTKKIGRLEAQFTKSLDTLESESHVTVRNLLDM